jgi:hypothetical protein
MLLKIILTVAISLTASQIGFTSFASPIKWYPIERGLPPNTISGSTASLTLINKSGNNVKIYWIKYNGTLQSYGELKTGSTKIQKTYSNSSWLVNSLDDKPLGYFRTIKGNNLAIIPERLPKTRFRTMRYTSRPSAEAIKWQKSLRTSLFGLLKINEHGSNKNLSPLNTVITSSQDKGTYLFHEMELDSTSKSRIKAVLTVPKKIKVPHPAVIVIDGHSGTRHSCYKDRGFATLLAEKGYITVSTKVSQHSLREEDKTMMGERLLDLIRCVDLLISMKEVDPKRIGCAGNSLGGEMAMWLGALDERISATMSAGFLTTMDQLEQNHCRCWKFPGIRSLVDFADIYCLIAPRPLMCQNGLKERPTWFTVPIARKALKEISPIYGDFEATNNLYFVPHKGGHVIDTASMFDFFDKHFNN